MDQLNVKSFDNLMDQESELIDSYTSEIFNKDDLTDVVNNNIE